MINTTGLVHLNQARDFLPPLKIGNQLGVLYDAK